MSKQNLSEESKQQIVDEWISGKKTIVQLAKEHGCSQQSIRNWAKKKITDTSVCDKTSSQLGVDIPANRVSIEKLYTSSEASKLAKITVDQLHIYVIKESIKAYIYNSKKYQFVDRERYKTYQFRHVDSVNATNSRDLDVYTPYLLNISTEDYKILIDAKENVEIKRFPLIVLKNDNHFSKKEPRQIAFSDRDTFSIGINIFDDEGYDSFYQINKKQNSIITSNIEDLRFLSKEFELFIKEEKSRIAIRSPVIELFATHPNKSSLLVDLDTAAFEIYGTYNPIKTAHYDTTEKISTYLMERFSFFKIHADVAAEVILPSTDNPIEEDSQGEYRTLLLQLLIHAWNELCINKEFKRHDEIKYDHDSESWFKEKFKHQLNLSLKNRRILAKIILPDNAPFHNPRRAKK